MLGFLSNVFGGRLRDVLMISFSLIAAITVSVGAVATSRTITDYLARAADERVARDMDLAVGEKGIVFDLLSFARQNRVIAQETDLNRLIASSAAEESTKDAYKGVRIVQDLAPRLPIIQADPDQLRQVLVNLMSNAVDAMTPGGGSLTICSRTPDRQHVELIVSDTGTGIPDAVTPNLFTPFFTTKPPGKGTGLGLSIIYGIVKMHRGDIRVQSTEGEGTTFTVLLPVRLPEVSPEMPQGFIAQGRGG